MPTLMRRRPDEAEEVRSAAPRSQGVADWVRREIASGRLAPGQRLIEAELARATGAGRSSVREALALLISAGVVSAEPHRGCIVRRLTRADVTELYAVREVLEGLAARTAAERHSDFTRTTMARTLAAATTARVPESAHAFMLANQAFHAAVVTLSRNALLARQLALAEAPVFALQFHRLLTQKALVVGNEEHAAIAGAIIAGKARAAEDAMRRHVRHGARLVAEQPDEVFGF